MNFRTAIDQLTARVTTENIAAAAGVSVYSIRQARLHSGSDASRPPPANWEQILARLARERGGELLNLADELERARGERKEVHG